MPRFVSGEHHIDSIVVLPEHLHCIWTLHDGDSDFSTRWKKIKARFSSGLSKTEKRSESRIKKGDILFGRPTSTGCTVTHCAVVMEEPDYFNGTIVWCIVGPIPARERGIDIGDYTPTAYEGIVRHSKEKLQVGRRYYFLPRYCMLQSRHSGLVNIIAKRDDGMRVRLEGIWIG